MLVRLVCRAMTRTVGQPNRIREGEEEGNQLMLLVALTSLRTALRPSSGCQPGLEPGLGASRASRGSSTNHLAC